MLHHDGLPVVFQFPEEDTQPESQEQKALWAEREMALREDATPGPAPVPAPVAPTVPPPIPVALMGWEPHIVAELDPTGFHEVPADFHAPVHLPAHTPARALTRTPVPVPVHLPAPAPVRALTCGPAPVPMHTNVYASPLLSPVPARVYKYRCQNRRISGRGSRSVHLRLMVTGGKGHDVLPRFGPSRWR